MIAKREAFFNPSQERIPAQGADAATKFIKILHIDPVVTVFRFLVLGILCANLAGCGRDIEEEAKCHDQLLSL
ncbi:MAG: hypothetical protein U0984_11405, partial [Prosthecobacter sp.]|nr:hypothetical protein [Prosthecobacter sp.]